jgi:hypothetical protein
LVESVFGRGGIVVAASGDYDADEVDYDNATSGLAATDVQAAIDELVAAGGSTDVQTFSVDGTWTKPVTAKRVLVMAFGAGGGGGSGRADASANAGGGAGGSGGAYSEIWYDENDLSATEAVTIGLGGTGGAAVAPTNNGNAGADGGNTSFGSICIARGGDGGVAGTTNSTVALTASYAGCDDRPVYNIAGGGSSGPPIPSATMARAGFLLAGGGGASAGGNFGASTAGAGGAGFQARKNIAIPVVLEGGGAGGVNGGSGSNGSTFGDGGGGGSRANTSSTNAGAGGNGAVAGGGGGGGGGARGTGNSGAGGNGGNGYMIVISFS